MNCTNSYLGSHFYEDCMTKGLKKIVIFKADIFSHFVYVKKKY